LAEASWACAAASCLSAAITPAWAFWTSAAADSSWLVVFTEVMGTVMSRERAVASETSKLACACATATS